MTLTKAQLDAFFGGDIYTNGVSDERFTCKTCKITQSVNWWDQPA